MDHDERKSRLHIHIGGLIIFIIIVFLLFKIDILSQIKSEQFQKNLTFIKGEISGFWNKYILAPVTSKAGSYIINTTQTEVNKVQSNLSNNLFKVPTTQDIEKQSQ